jgi:hypothetical protein
MFKSDYRSQFYIHFFMATFLGFALRALSSYFSYGAQSLDDYTHGIIPAIEWIQGKDIQIPDWRSPLLVWFLGFFLKVGKFLGVESIFSQIKWILFSLGTFSTLIVLTYGHYANKYLLTEKNKSVLIFSSYLLNLHPLLIFSQTRAFGESIAMVFLFVSSCLFYSYIKESPQKKNLELHLIFFSAWLMLGLACLFRFQVGIIAVLAFVYFFYFSFSKKNWLLLTNMLIACSLILLFCAIIDLQFNRKVFSTLSAYLAINQDVGSKHTNQPWWNTWLTFFGMFFVPLTLPFIGHIKKLSKTEMLVLFLTLIFVLIHSFVAHKEERFLYPILPFIVLIFSKLWFESLNTFYEKFIFRPLIIILSTAGITLVVFSNSQAGEFDTYYKIEEVNAPIYFWEESSLISEGYFRPKFIELLNQKNKIFYDEKNRAPALQELLDIKKNWDFLFFSASTQESVNKNIQLAQEQEFICEPTKNMQSFGDKIIYSLNPKVNQRRKPVWTSLCKAVAR